MISKLCNGTAILKLNEYIETRRDVATLIEQIEEDLFIDTVVIENDGCKDNIVRYITRELIDCDIKIKDTI